MERVKKFLRTAQSACPAAKPLKDLLYLHSRRILQIPHEHEFSLLKYAIPDPAVLIDVGANHGQSIESLRLFFQDCAIHAFEPHPHLAQRLADRYRSNVNTRIYAAGLSATEGAFTLWVPSYNGFVYDGLASFSSDEALGWLNKDRMYFFDEGKLAVEQVMCRCRPLDSFGLKPDFIKVDVQGHEMAFLTGAIETIRACEPLLMIEAPGDAVHDRLRGMGYVECKIEDGKLREGRQQSAHGNLFFATDRLLRSS